MYSRPMQLTIMSDSEYNSWELRSKESYAADKMKANDFTKEEANKVATDDFARLLPLGQKSEDNFLFSAKDDSVNLVGFVWFGVRGAADNKRAFIYDIIVEEQYRGKGYGRQIMLLLEQEVKKQGLGRVGLHVFGFNKVAISLYQSLGYTTTDLVMEKKVP